MPGMLNIRLLALAGLGVGVAAVVVIGLDRLYGDRAASASTAQWQYASTADGARTATLQSRNRLKEPAPFKGGPATLSLARGPDGYVVKLDVDADMACGYAPTASTVQVSFDGGAPRTFACAPAPDDHSRLLFDGAHSTAYLADPVAFLAQLRNARHVRITGEFAGQTASQAMEFDLPAVDPVAQVSPASVQVAQASIAAPAVSPPAAVPVASAVPVAAVAPPNPVESPKVTPAAEVVAGDSPNPMLRERRAVRVAIHHHVPGYYLHPYRPAFRKPEHHRAYW